MESIAATYPNENFATLHRDTKNRPSLRVELRLRQRLQVAPSGILIQFLGFLQRGNQRFVRLALRRRERRVKILHRICGRRIEYLRVLRRVEAPPSPVRSLNGSNHKGVEQQNRRYVFL